MNISKFELDIIDRFNTILQKDKLFLSIVDDKSQKTGYQIRLLDTFGKIANPSILFYWHDIQDVFYKTKNNNTFFQLNDIYNISNIPELKHLVGCHSLEEVAIKLDLLGVK